MPRICPVIHATDLDQVVANIYIAMAAGADDVFLINHSIDAGDLNAILLEVRRRTDFWIGLNYLGLPDHWLVPLATHADAIWMDGLPKAPLATDKPVFGGVGFKYQHTGLTLAEEVERAKPLVDVLVTSGPATGQSAPIEKVKQLKALAGDKPIGLASGLTPGNVREYLPWVDWLLVATGVSKDFTTLCREKLGAFTGVVRG